MGMTPQETRYINRTLADLLERALEFQRLADKASRSNKDKAVWKALALDSARAYNHALLTLAPLASSKLALEQRPLINSYFKANGFGLSSELEVQEIIDNIFGDSKAEREALIISANREKAQILALGIKLTDEVKEALQILAKRNMLGKIITPERLNELIDNPPTRASLPRGNPAKGGLVRKYMHDGKHTHAEALAMAEAELGENNYQNSTNPSSHPISTDAFDSFVDSEMFEDSKGNAITLAQAFAQVSSEPKPQPMDLLNLLQDLNTEAKAEPLAEALAEAEAKAKIPPNSSSTKIPFSTN